MIIDDFYLYFKVVYTFHLIFNAKTLKSQITPQCSDSNTEIKFYYLLFKFCLFMTYIYSIDVSH